KRETIHFHDHVNHRQNKRKARNQESYLRAKSHQIAGETDQPVQAYAQRAEELVIVSLASITRRPVEQYKGLLETYHRHHPAKETVGLLQLIDFIDHATAHQPEVTCVWRNGHLSDPVNDLVADIGHDSFDQGLSGAASSLRHDYLITFLP